MLDRSIGELSRFIIIALGTTILGFATGHWWLALCSGLTVYLIWLLWQQNRFDRWLSNGRRGPAPTSFGVWGDITDDFYRIQRRHRKEKQKLHAMLRRVQDSTSALREGIVALEDDGNLAWWNPVAGEMLRLQADDSGQPIINFVRDPRFVEHMHERMRGTNQGDLQPITLPAPGDDSRTLQMEVTRFGQDEALVIVRDITRLHNLEQMRRDFVANVSHELRTPLTVIAGYLETLQESGQAPRNWERPLGQMSEQTVRMTSLVNDLLLLARLETSERDSGRDRIAVNGLMERVADEARSLSGGRHQISVVCDADCTITGDAGELHSAFANLAFNAVKYSPDGGPIELRWRMDASGGHFAVKDSGIGIDPLHIPRLTERFYRVDAGRSRESGGTGLGLAIVKHVLLRHSANMSISSVPGRGSTFTLNFPSEKLTQASSATS
ncbi:phosphate regulon sensor histidine kinase PhoR [Microbulbifer agarilyticus]|uniref:phosphate regulon sensor histidine kinase PhoR n=1 Tax=Microbulbifer agarilyticus TaxID=260552 RepID=UPI001C9590A4|nr:phosphate regulon sensor histidine kinase PhoR [Microbulbifer agarilyticus]MBY6190894.1 phosphate regulon sensor histidine kinase PhoR [Microbulbifer agarilyticus]MCA0893480.1 phosphate regulon sensor histidine kinase PhoR [Microbulbifer agarilyticus]